MPDKKRKCQMIGCRAEGDEIYSFNENDPIRKYLQPIKTDAYLCHYHSLIVDIIWKLKEYDIEIKIVESIEEALTTIGISRTITTYMDHTNHLIPTLFKEDVLSKALGYKVVINDKTPDDVRIRNTSNIYYLTTAKAEEIIEDIARNTVTMRKRGG